MAADSTSLAHTNDSSKGCTSIGASSSSSSSAHTAAAAAAAAAADSNNDSHHQKMDGQYGLCTNLLQMTHHMLYLQWQAGVEPAQRTKAAEANTGIMLAALQLSVVAMQYTSCGSSSCQQGLTSHLFRVGVG